MECVVTVIQSRPIVVEFMVVVFQSNYGSGLSYDF